MRSAECRGRSSWIGNRLISVLGMATTVGELGGLTTDKDICGRRAPQGSGAMSLTGGQNRDQHEQEPEGDRVADDPVRAMADPLRNRHRRTLRTRHRQPVGMAADLDRLAL